MPNLLERNFESDKPKQDAIIVENDRQIAELRAKNEELEKECELLRGRLLLAIQYQ